MARKAGKGTGVEREAGKKVLDKKPLLLYFL
jgi:hypothetical protein